MFEFGRDPEKGSGCPLPLFILGNEKLPRIKELRYHPSRKITDKTKSLFQFPLANFHFPISDLYLI